MTASTASANACSGAQHILAAALDVFAERGYNGASMHAISERAQVSKANVFHHFASKEQLYMAVLRKASHSWGENLARAKELDSPFAKQLQLLIERILQQLEQEPAQSRVVLREMLENGPLRGRQLNDEIFVENFATETGIFRRAHARHELRAGVDPVLAWAATTAACLFFFQTRDVLRFNPDFPYADQPQQFAKGICDILLGGIAAQPEIPS